MLLLHRQRPDTLQATSINDTSATVKFPRLLPSCTSRPVVVVPPAPPMAEDFSSFAVPRLPASEKTCYARFSGRQNAKKPDGFLHEWQSNHLLSGIRPASVALYFEIALHFLLLGPHRRPTPYMKLPLFLAEDPGGRGAGPTPGPVI